MKRFWAACVGGAVLTATGWAQEAPFSQALKADDFTAAGLAKLTPDERAQLDHLVEAYKHGALETAQQQAAAAVAAQAAAEARATKAESAVQAAQAQAAAQTEEAAQAQAQARAAQAQAEKDHAAAKAAAAQAKAGGSNFVDRAKALLMPGTKITYQPTEAHIVGWIKGWDPHSVFNLDNGQAWEVSDESMYFNGKAVQNAKVTIREARFFGGFELEIAGMGSMRVRLINHPSE
jgi:hypothetical protein